jgi:hypothetical protein
MLWLFLAGLALYVAVILDRWVSRRVAIDKHRWMLSRARSFEVLDVQLSRATVRPTPYTLWDYLTGC